MQHHLSPPGRRLVAACLAAAALPATASAATPAEVNQSIAAGVGYIRTEQLTTGDLGSADALGALSAAGVHPADVRTSAADPSAQDFYAARYATTTNPSSGGVLDAYAAGVDPQRVAAQNNLVANLAAYYNATSTGALEGSFSASVNLTSNVALGFARIKAPQALLARTNAYLRAQRHADGGWNLSRVTTAAQRDAPSDVDQTGSTLAALCETGSGADDPDIRAGLSFLRSQQDPATGDVGNADSIAFAVQGLNACGIDPQGQRFTTAQGKTLIDALISQQVAGGGFTYNGGDNIYSTQDAVRALAGESLSAEPPRRANPADARLRPVPAVAAGTVVPHMLVIDDGAGDLRACKFSVAVDAALPDALEAARTGATPAGCVTSVTSSGGNVTEINGDTGTWQLRLDSAPEAQAGTQPVAFGQTVSLRRVVGPGGQGVQGAPGANGTTGSAGEGGTAGANGANGVAGSPGPAGAAGAKGAPGSTGAAGRDAQVTCTATRSGRRVTCTVSASGAGARTAKATLARRGRVYAHGTLGRLTAVRSVTRGSYTLRLTRAGRTTTLPITVR